MSTASSVARIGARDFEGLGHGHLTDASWPGERSEGEMGAIPETRTEEALLVERELALEIAAPPQTVWELL
jgi:hypothetical protein